MDLVGSDSTHFDVIITDSERAGVFDMVTKLREGHYEGGLIVISSKAEAVDARLYQELAVKTISDPVSLLELLKSVQTSTSIPGK